jgi:hypothetical protein
MDIHQTYNPVIVVNMLQTVTIHGSLVWIAHKRYAFFVLRKALSRNFIH